MNKYILEICPLCWNFVTMEIQKILMDDAKYQRVSCMHYYLANKKLSKQKKIKARMKYLNLNYDYLNKNKN